MLQPSLHGLAFVQTRKSAAARCFTPDHEGEESHCDCTAAGCTVSLPREELSRRVLPQDEMEAWRARSANSHRSQIGPYSIPYAHNERAYNESVLVKWDQQVSV